jgi:hypothetical protein
MQDGLTDATRVGLGDVILIVGDVRAQLQAALALPASSPDTVDGALDRAAAWLTRGIDGEVWGTVRLLADEVTRLRKFEPVVTQMVAQEKAFAENCERVMAGMDVEAKALAKARVDATADADRLREVLNRIATDYDYSPAGQAAKAALAK